MVLNKIPSFQEVKDWANANFTYYTDTDASAAAPVQSVNNETGDVAVQVPNLNYVVESQNIPADTNGEVFWKTVDFDSATPVYFRIGANAGQSTGVNVRGVVTFDNGSTKEYSVSLNVPNNSGGSNYFTQDSMYGYYNDLNGTFPMDNITDDGWMIDSVDLYYEGKYAGDGGTARFRMFSI